LYVLFCFFVFFFFIFLELLLFILLSVFSLLLGNSDNFWQRGSNGRNHSYVIPRIIWLLKLLLNLWLVTIELWSSDDFKNRIILERTKEGHKKFLKLLSHLKGTSTFTLCFSPMPRQFIMATVYKGLLFPLLHVSVMFWKSQESIWIPHEAPSQNNELLPIAFFRIKIKRNTIIIRLEWRDNKN
jgi:hypothetical protein